jgi:hypothetical protein
MHAASTRSLRCESLPLGRHFERRFDPVAQPGLSSPIDELGGESIHLDPVSEYQIRGNSVRSECIEYIAPRLDVDLDDPHSPGELLCQRLDDRQLPDATTSPLGKEIDQHDALRGVNFRASRFGGEGFEPCAGGARECDNPNECCESNEESIHGLTSDIGRMSRTL